jgi:hypothetical protein
VLIPRHNVGAKATAAANRTGKAPRGSKGSIYTAIGPPPVLAELLATDTSASIMVMVPVRCPRPPSCRSRAGSVECQKLLIREAAGRRRPGTSCQPTLTSFNITATVQSMPARMITRSQRPSFACESTRPAAATGTRNHHSQPTPRSPALLTCHCITVPAPTFARTSRPASCGSYRWRSTGSACRGAACGPRPPRIVAAERAAALL